jgi:hypothetical protein
MKSLFIPILALCVLPFSASAGETGKVQVVTSFNQAAQCISPVHIKKIDGKEATVQRMGFTLEPGKHTLSGSAVINLSNCPAVGSTTRHHAAGPLEAVFEPGKVYYVGYDHSSADRNDWKIVIWKVEDEKS